MPKANASFRNPASSRRSNPASTASITRPAAADRWQAPFEPCAAVRQQLRLRNNGVDQPDAVALRRRRNRLAREHHFQGASASHQPWQALRTAVTRNEPEFHFRLSQFGVLGSEAYRTGHRQFAIRRPVQIRSSPLPRACRTFPGGGTRAGPAEKVARFRRRKYGQFVDIGARHKCLVAGPGNHWRANRGLGCNPFKSVRQLLNNLSRKSVELVRPVYRKYRDTGVSAWKRMCCTALRISVAPESAAQSLLETCLVSYASVGDRVRRPKARLLRRVDGVACPSFY